MIATSGLVDFHCHLDLYPDHAVAVREAEAAGVFTLAVTTTPRAWLRNHELAQRTKHVRAALGLHPQLVAERAGELPLWEHHLAETAYVGEVGLDAGARFYKSMDAQKHVFRQVLTRCAEAGGKILTVHSVRSVPAVLDMIERYLPQERGTVVLHWFTGSKSEARRAASLGCYFSVNLQMTRSDRGRALVADLPMDRVLTETDGPFTEIDGRPAEPGDVQTTIEAVARARDASIGSIAASVRSNVEMLLSKSGELPP